MGELTNKDLQDAFMEGFCYAEDIGHTTGKKLAAEAERRYPATANAEGLLTLLKRFAVNYSLRMIEKGHELETCNCDACTDIRKARELTADAALALGEGEKK